MPSSELPPEGQTKVKPFDPLVLDRTVIAVPLLSEMKEDLDLLAKVKVPPQFNLVIKFKFSALSTRFMRASQTV